MVFDYGTLTGLEFEQLVTNMLMKFGYKDVKNRRGTADGGIDVEATSVTPISTNTIAIQCKRYADNKVRLHHVRNLDSAVKNEDFTSGVIITSGEFTSDAINFAKKSSVKIRLIDGLELSNLLVQAFPGISSLSEIINLEENNLLPKHQSLVSVHVDNNIQENMLEAPTTKVIDESKSETSFQQPEKYDPLDALPQTVKQPINKKSKKDSLLGSIVEIEGRTFQIVSKRQIDALNSKKIGINCPSCNFPLLEGNYCIFEDWIFQSLKFNEENKRRLQTDVIYCSHHPTTPLKGSRQYCPICDWHYS